MRPKMALIFGSESDPFKSLNSKREIWERNQKENWCCEKVDKFGREIAKIPTFNPWNSKSLDCLFIFQIDFPCNCICIKVGSSKIMSEHRRPAVATGGIELKDDVTAVSELSTTTTMDVESLRKKLRQRWELASVLNFLHVTTLLHFLFSLHREKQFLSFFYLHRRCICLVWKRFFQNGFLLSFSLESLADAVEI